MHARKFFCTCIFRGIQVFIIDRRTLLVDLLKSIECGRGAGPGSVVAIDSIQHAPRFISTLTVFSTVEINLWVAVASCARGVKIAPAAERVIPDAGQPAFPVLALIRPI